MPVSGFTVMSFVKFSRTGNTVAMTCGSGTTPMYSFKEKAGIITFQTDTTSLTATNIKLGKWYHLLATVDSTTASSSGCYFYVDGSLASYNSTITSFPSITDGRIVFGKELNLTSSGLTGCVGMTRIINRTFSRSEILHNYFSTITPMVEIDSIRIG